MQEPSGTAFRHDEQDWYLVDKDTGTQYRSPINSGDPADYAYLGRLPRRTAREHSSTWRASTHPAIWALPSTSPATSPSCTGN